LPLSSAVASARSIELEGGTTSLVADDLVLSVPETADHPAFEARVGHASLRGLVPLGRRSNLRAPLRAFFLGSSATFGAIASSFAVLARSLDSRAFALAVGLVGPVASLLGLSALERDISPAWAYALLPLASFTCPLAAASFVNFWLGRRAREGG
jgi:hypothetical protein